MKRLLFATVGTSDASISSVVHAVREYNPDHVVFFTTEEGRAEAVSGVVEELGLLDEAEVTDEDRASWTYSAPEHEEFEHELDAGRLFVAYRRQICEELATRDAELENAVSDFSEGTRPMSAALFEASISVGVPVISYVTGERDASGEVIPGTERSRAVHGRRFRAAEGLRDAVDMFNAGRFGVAREMAERFDETPEAFLPHGGRAQFLVRTAAAAFEAWDRFRLEEALETMQLLGESDRVETSFVAEHLMSQERRQGVVQRHLHHAVEREMYFGLLGDVVANAERRVRREAWDDAVARLYRALEYVAQLRIHEEYGFDTAEVPVDELPEALQGRFGERETCSLALADAWTFLRGRGDPVGEAYARLAEESDLLRAVRKRNASILAHGFESVGPEYAEILREAVDELVCAAWSEQRWQEALEACRFPRIVGFHF